MQWVRINELPPAASLGTVVFRTPFPSALTKARPLRRWLQPEELERLERFKVESAALHYLQTRALLRIVLTHTLGCSNSELRLHYSHSKKPILAPEMQSSLQFNATHTAGWGGVALVPQTALGLDFEAHAPTRDLPAIARRHFSPVEQAAIEALPPGERVGAFFDTWTAKEACVKASGDGITADLQAFTTRLGPAPTVDLPGTWTLFRLPMPPGLSAALAIRGEAPSPQLYEIHRAQLLHCKMP